MKYQTIDEIYIANEAVRAKLKTSIENLTPEQSSRLPEGEKWSIAQIVEHIVLVEDGMIRICRKLLREADAAGKHSDGTVKISDVFLKKAMEMTQVKVEAPDIVKPVARKSISESLDMMETNRNRLNELRPLFESLDGSEFKFPHPFLGEISAHEWLVLKGGHEARHLRQIKRLLEQI